MISDNQHDSTWDRRQAELWDRIFQVTQDVATLADSMEDSAGGVVVKQEMVRTAMAVGTELVRANAAEDSTLFHHHVHEARLKAIETDYWLRLAYILQQQDDVQRDLSSIITQYSAIVDLLQKFIRHTRAEKNVIARHTRGPRIS
ncbi:MAG: four helix bundle protein [Candidatus Andersenbacteria bacterium]